VVWEKLGSCQDKTALIEMLVEFKERYAPQGGTPPSGAEVNDIGCLIRSHQDVLVAEIAMGYPACMHSSDDLFETVKELFIRDMHPAVQWRSIDVLNQIPVPVHGREQTGDSWKPIQQTVDMEFPPHSPPAEQAPVPGSWRGVVTQDTFSSIPPHQPNIGLAGGMSLMKELDGAEHSG